MNHIGISHTKVIHALSRFMEPVHANGMSGNRHVGNQKLLISETQVSPMEPRTVPTVPVHSASKLTSL